jgi:hypothetical protein
MFAFLLMMAGYLVIRFVVMTAPVWATVAIIPQTQGILRSAASVAAAAVVHPVIMAVGASISVLTTGYLLNPDTGLGWLGLLLSVLFTAMMWTVLKPYRRLRGLVTGEPVETPGQALNRLKAQATGLAQADYIDTTAADATTTAPDPAPATGIVTVRYRPTRPDHTPTWAREDDHDHEHDDQGGPQGTPGEAPSGEPGTADEVRAGASGREPPTVPVAEVSHPGELGTAPDQQHLEAQAAGQQISRGHAFDKHAVQRAEFPGILSREQFAKMIETVILKGQMRSLSAGRTAYWHNGVVVVKTPQAEDGGTAFKPRGGYEYFQGLY